MTDTEIRAWLAERWSRSQPKEAALDYMADGIWQDRQRECPGGQKPINPAKHRERSLARYGRRQTTTRWPASRGISGGPPSAGVMPRRSLHSSTATRQVLVAYEDLRERTRARKATTVALSGAFQETLTRHAVLLKQADDLPRPARTTSPPCWPSAAASGARTSMPFEYLHTRARRHRRAATMRYVHRIKREAELQGIEVERRQGVLALEGGAIEAPERAETEERNTIAAPAEVHADVAVPVRNVQPAKRYWYAPYMTLRQDWNAFIEGARQAGILSFYAEGYADMIPRIRALAENSDVPAVTRAPMMQVLENHQRYLSTRKHIEDYLNQVDRHIEEHDSMESLAEELDMKVAEISDYPDWRRENDRLIVPRARPFSRTWRPTVPISITS